MLVTMNRVHEGGATELELHPLEHMNEQISQERQEPADQHGNHDCAIQQCATDDVFLSTSTAHEAPPTLSWQPTDASYFSPSTLPLTRAVRAWDRKPQSPFSRRRLKVGKVWKRAMPPVPSTSAMGTALGANKRRVSFSPSKKAVKKIRLDEGLSAGAAWETLSRPDRRIVTRAGRQADEVLVQLSEVPSATKDIQAQVEDAHISFDSCEDDDPTLEGGWEDTDQDLAAEDVSQAISTGEALVELVEDRRRSNTRTSAGSHLRRSLALEELLADGDYDGDALTLDEADNDHGVPSVVGLPLNGALSETRDGTGVEEPAEEAYAQVAVTDEAYVPAETSLIRQMPLVSQPVVLPAGFVSPVKQSRRRSIRDVRRANAGRRQTLPVSFATAEAITGAAGSGKGSAPTEQGAASTKEVKEPGGAQGHVEEPAYAHQVAEDDMEVVTTDTQSVEESDGWEDIEEEEPAVDAARISVANQDAVVMPGDGAHTSLVTTDSANNVDEASVPCSSDGHEERAADAESERPPTPISIEIATLDSKLHPSSLGLGSSDEVHGPPHRRSPRRKSSSPRKRGKSGLALETKSHLIAFTPIKRPELRVESCPVEEEQVQSPLTTRPASAAMNGRSPSHLVCSPAKIMVDTLERQAFPDRSSSAPPESPRISPRRTRQPRISDDTALLQAFLNRAAETRSKADRRMSATKRESLENVRDSDTVRQALASSPAGLSAIETKAVPDVLKDLDPNSPSPRKQLFLPHKETPSEQDSKAPSLQLIPGEASATLNDSLPSDERSLSPTEGSRKRRSTRTKKTASSSQVQAQPASEPSNVVDSHSSTSTNLPNKISIRANSGSGDGIVLRKTEAQEMAALTKANTRKNKGSAMMPGLRLTRLGALDDYDELGDGDMSATVGSKVNSKGRNVRWAETLEAFQHLVASTSAETTETFEATETRDEPAREPGPAKHLRFESQSDTANKPRVRKLKPRLTPRPACALPPGADSPLDEPSLRFELPPSSAPANDNSTRPAAASRVKRKSRIATPAKAKGASSSVLSVAGEDDGFNDTLQGMDLVVAPLEARPTPTALPKRAPPSKLPAPISAVGGLAPPATIKDREQPASLIASPPKKLRVRASTRQQQQREQNQQQRISSLAPPVFSVPSLSNSFPTSASTGPRSGTGSSGALTFGTSAPRLETNKSLSATPHSSAHAGFSDLASPAKKAPRLFGNPPNMSGLGAETMRERVPMSGVMSSPAKKRTRR